MKLKIKVSQILFLFTFVPILLFSLGLNVFFLLKINSPAFDEKNTNFDVEKFNALQENMTLEQVEKVMGRKGYLHTYGDIRGLYSMFYQWQDEQGNDLTVMFHDGLLKGRVMRGRGGWSHCKPLTPLPSELRDAIENGY